MTNCSAILFQCHDHKNDDDATIPVRRRSLQQQQHQQEQQKQPKQLPQRKTKRRVKLCLSKNTTWIVPARKAAIGDIDDCDQEVATWYSDSEYSAFQLDRVVTLSVLRKEQQKRDRVEREQKQQQHQRQPSDDENKKEDCVMCISNEEEDDQNFTSLGVEDLLDRTKCQATQNLVKIHSRVVLGQQKRIMADLDSSTSSMRTISEIISVPQVKIAHSRAKALAAETAISAPLSPSAPSSSTPMPTSFV